MLNLELSHEQKMYVREKRQMEWMGKNGENGSDC